MVVNVKLMTLETSLSTILWLSRHYLSDPFQPFVFQTTLNVGGTKHHTTGSLYDYHAVKTN